MVLRLVAGRLFGSASFPFFFPFFLLVLLLSLSVVSRGVYSILPFGSHAGHKKSINIEEWRWEEICLTCVRVSVSVSEPSCMFACLPERLFVSLPLPLSPCPTSLALSRGFRFPSQPANISDRPARNVLLCLFLCSLSSCCGPGTPHRGLSRVMPARSSFLSSSSGLYFFFSPELNLAQSTSHIALFRHRVSSKSSIMS